MVAIPSMLEFPPSRRQLLQSPLKWSSENLSIVVGQFFAALVNWINLLLSTYKATHVLIKQIFFIWQGSMSFCLKSLESQLSSAPNRQHRIHH